MLLKLIIKLGAILVSLAILSGCLAAVAGAGAVGGYEFHKHYKVTKKIGS